MSISLVVNGMAHTRGRGAGNPAALGHSRFAETDRHQIRLRHRSVRRLHGPDRRPGDAVLHDAGADAVGKAITTIEGLSVDGTHPVQLAWIEFDVPQCGYCQSGQIMAAVALLKKNPKPTDADIDASMDNICRCGTYLRIREAIHRAAELQA